MKEPVEGFFVETPGFRGTLLELAQALRSGALEPQQLDVFLLVRSYLAYFERVAASDLELASEALPLVARIVELKVRFLLPRPPKDSEEEVANELEEALEAITLLEDLEDAIHFLRARRAERRVMLPAKTPRPSYPRPERPLKVGVARLQELAARYRVSAYFELAIERFTLAAAMTSLMKRLGRLRHGALHELAEHRTWGVLTVTFAGMLELHKENKLRAHQTEAFGPIELELAEEASARAEAA